MFEKKKKGKRSVYHIYSPFYIPITIISIKTSKHMPILNKYLSIQYLFAFLFIDMSMLGKIITPHPQTVYQLVWLNVFFNFLNIAGNLIESNRIRFSKIVETTSDC